MYADEGIYGLGENGRGKIPNEQKNTNETQVSIINSFHPVV